MINVLDHGFVELVDYMGGDKRVVDAARVSYLSEGKTSEDDEKLIRYLIKNEHWSPFEQVVFTFRIKLPIFVMRQLVRHRTARINEVSGRYTEFKEEYYLPDLDRIKGQDKKNKQGSSGDLEDFVRKDAREAMETVSDLAFLEYNQMIRDGVARELARIILPVNYYTMCYWQIDLRNLLNFLKLRADEHAQYEIRVYAEAIESMVKSIAPISYGAFNEYKSRGNRD